MTNKIEKFETLLRIPEAKMEGGKRLKILIIMIDPLSQL